MYKTKQIQLVKIITAGGGGYHQPPATTTISHHYHHQPPITKILLTPPTRWPQYAGRFHTRKKASKFVQWQLVVSLNLVPFFGLESGPPFWGRPESDPRMVTQKDLKQQLVSHVLRSAFWGSESNPRMVTQTKPMPTVGGLIKFGPFFWVGKRSAFLGPTRVWPKNGDSKRSQATVGLSCIAVRVLGIRI